MKKIILAVFIVAITGIPAVIMPYNPFIEKPAKGESNSSGIIKGKFMKKIIVWQGKLNRKISGKIEDFKKDRKPGLFIITAFIIFLYGSLHALGPGHGKTIISSWVISSRKKYKSVALVSTMSAVFHALSAALIVSLSYLLLNRMLTEDTAKIRGILQLAAGIIITLIGIYMFLNTFFPAGNKKVFRHFAAKRNEKLQPLLLAGAIGLVPCPATSIILIFSFSYGLVAEGFIFVMFFAAGMALTQITIASGVWHLREKAEYLQEKNLGVVTKIILPATASVVLVILGVFIILPYIF